MSILNSKNTLDFGPQFPPSFVPISRRGDFFQDDFFKESRERFFNSMNEFSLRRNMPGYQRPTLIDMYKHSKSAINDTDEKPITFTKEGNVYKIIMDVKEYETDKLAVKAVGDDQLIVEGVLKNPKNSQNKNVSKNFKIPGFKLSEISAVLSSDDVFTVQVPVENTSPTEVKVPISRVEAKKSPQSTEPKQSQNAPTSSSIQQPTKTTILQSQSSTTKEKSPVGSVGTGMQNQNKIQQQYQNMKQDLSQYQSQSVKQPGQNMNQLPSQSASQPMNQGGNQPLNQSTSQPPNQNMNQPTTQNANQPTAQKVDQPLILSNNPFFNQNISQNKKVVSESMSQSSRSEQSLSSSSSREKFMSETQTQKVSPSGGVQPQGVFSQPSNTVSQESHSQNSQQQKLQESYTGGVPSQPYQQAGSAPPRTGPFSSGLNATTQPNKDPKSGFVISENSAFTKNIKGSQSSMTKETSQQLKPGATYQPKAAGTSQANVPNQGISQQNQANIPNLSKNIPSQTLPSSAAPKPVNYGSLPSQIPKESTLQIDSGKPKKNSTITENQYAYKVVLDIQDYLKGNVKVNVSSNSELVIEGCIENSEIYSNNSSFRRSFLLKDMGSSEDIVARITTDGLLVVHIPKKDAPKDQNLFQFTPSNSTTTPVGPQNAAPVQQATHKPTQTQPPPQTASQLPLSTQKPTLPGQQVNTLPIAPTNSFFQNPNLENEHKKFLEKVRSVFNQWGSTDFSGDLQTYQNLRNKMFSEANQVVSFSEDEKCHKITLDVYGFTADEINVKVINNFHLIVEGNSHASNSQNKPVKSFKQHMQLPKNINFNNIESMLSSDGVLSILLPKNVDPQPSRERIIPVNIESETSEESGTEAAASKHTYAAQNAAPGPSKPMQQTFSAPNFTPGVKQQNETQGTAATQQLQNLAEKVAMNQNKLATEKYLSSSNQYQGTTSQKHEALSQKSSTQEPSVRPKTAPQAAQQKSQPNQDTNTQQPTQTSQYVPFSNFGLGSFPITPRGRFFDDSFFKKVQEDYNSAMNNILQNHNLPPQFNGLDQYKNFRMNDSQKENQAVSITEDKDFHKIVLDVGDFNAGDIAVKANNDNEIIVEGELKDKKPNDESTKDFKRSFYLPNPINMKDVTSALSSDGVLTIMAPKKKSSIQVIGEDGKPTDLQVSNPYPGQGSSWQESQESTSSGDGFISRSMSKSFHSHYSS